MSPRARSRARGSLVQAAAWELTTVAALDCVLGTALLDVSADRASLDATDGLYFVFLMPSWGSRGGISR